MFYRLFWVHHFNENNSWLHLGGGGFYLTMLMCFGGLYTSSLLIHVYHGCYNRFVEVFVQHISGESWPYYGNPPVWILDMFY